MARLASTDIVRIRSDMGTDIRVTAVFATDAEANSYLSGHPGEGVIATAGGRVWIGSTNDLGERTIK
jgi:hypothetical protein